MVNKRRELDFATWLAESRRRHSFRDCVRSAADSLALGPGDLRSRLYSALFCLCFWDGQDVPEAFRPEFEAIRQEIQRRTGAAADVPLRDVDLGRLRRSVRRCKIATAERIARRIIEWDRAMTVRGTGTVSEAGQGQPG